MFSENQISKATSDDAYLIDCQIENPDFSYVQFSLRAWLGQKIRMKVWVEI